VRKIVGEEKFDQYGGVEITMGQFDAMMKDGAISAEIKKQLKAIVYHTTGQPFVQSKRKAAFDV